MTATASGNTARTYKLEIGFVHSGKIADSAAGKYSDTMLLVHGGTQLVPSKD